MKNLLLGLVILSSLVACGKNNSVGSATTSNSAISVGTLPANSQALATQLGNIVNNNQFGLGQATYYENWNQYTSHAPNTTYSYGVLSTSGSSGSNPCRTVGYIFTICTSTVTTTSSSSATISRTVIHSSVDLQAKKNEIIAIINKTNQIQTDGYGVYYILTTDNINYVIDTRYPIQANPAQVRSAAGAGDTLVRIQ